MAVSRSRTSASLGRARGLPRRIPRKKQPGRLRTRKTRRHSRPRCLQWLPEVAAVAAAPPPASSPGRASGGAAPCDLRATAAASQGTAAAPTPPECANANTTTTRGGNTQCRISIKAVASSPSARDDQSHDHIFDACLLLAHQSVDLEVTLRQRCLETTVPAVPTVLAVPAYSPLSSNTCATPATALAAVPSPGPASVRRRRLRLEGPRGRRSSVA